MKRFIAFVALLCVAFGALAADPSSSVLASGDSTSATTTVNFSAQPTGTLLTLCYMGDDYTVGVPSGWSQAADIGDAEGAFAGATFVYRMSDGSVNSVPYVIGSASKSTYLLTAHTNIQTSSPLDVVAKQNTNTTDTSYTTPTSPTTAAQRLYAIACIGGHRSSAAFTGIGSWTNSYTEIGEKLGATAAPYFVIGMAGLAFDGGGTTSTGATYNEDTVSRIGIITTFKVNTGGGGGSALPVIIQQQSMNAANDDEYLLAANSRH